jgi:hypothetical protein
MLNHQIAAPVWLLAIAPILLAFVTGAVAADHSILGDEMLVKSPKPDDATKRKVVASAREKSSADLLVGDPTVAGSAGGAVLGVIANGGTSTARAYLLPQGAASNGKPFWKATKTGFRYVDAKGEQRPVRNVVISRSGNGTFTMKAKLFGKGGDLDVVPPNPGTDGFLSLSLAGGDRYCAQYGPEGQSRNDGDKLWKIQDVTAESCAMAGEFSLLNYNVAGLPQGISGSDPETNTPLIAPLLNGYDVVLVQESWETPDPNPLAPLRVYHEILRAGSQHPYKSPSKPNPFNTDPERPGAILSDGLNYFSRFPFGTVLREAWDGCDNSAADCLATKGFSMARITFAPGVEVDVYDFHEDEPDGTQYQRLLDEGGFTDSCDAVGCSGPLQIEKTFFRSSDTVTLTALSWRLEDDVFVRDDDEPLSDHPALDVRFRWEAVTD